MILHFLANSLIPNKHIYQNTVSPEDLTQVFFKKCSPFCSQPVKKKHRARVIEFFIDVARECFNIGNFNSLMAIICELVFCFLPSEITF